MKSLRAILSCLFALLVFVSSSSFSIGIHACSGQVKAIAFLDKADGCDHRNLPPCHRKMMEKCCDDEVVAYQGQGFDQHVSLNAPAASTFVMIAPPVVLLSEVIPAAGNIAAAYIQYDPPRPAINRTIVLQTFLI